MPMSHAGEQLSCCKLEAELGLRTPTKSATIRRGGDANPVQRPFGKLHNEADAQRIEHPSRVCKYLNTTYLKKNCASTVTEIEKLHSASQPANGYCPS
jgi:hypothetical protein